MYTVIGFLVTLSILAIMWVMIGIHNGTLGMKSLVVLAVGLAIVFVVLRREIPRLIRR